MSIPRRPPASLRRQLLVEAGHRCAIPTCRATAPLEFEHIVDWATDRKHEFENMIVLCANCHGRKGNGTNEIDRKSLKIYKANLGLITSRYIDFERRVLEVMAYQVANVAQVEERPSFQLPMYMRMSIMNLVFDGLIEAISPGTWLHTVVPGEGAGIQRVPSLPRPGQYDPEGLRRMEFWRLTAAGAEFVMKWSSGQMLDDADLDDDDDTVAMNSNPKPTD